MKFSLLFAKYLELFKALALELFVCTLLLKTVLELELDLLLFILKAGTSVIISSLEAITCWYHDSALSTNAKVLDLLVNVVRLSLLGRFMVSSPLEFSSTTYASDQIVNNFKISSCTIFLFIMLDIWGNKTCSSGGTPVDLERAFKDNTVSQTVNNSLTNFIASWSLRILSSRG
ncbi:hypothetical protein AWRI1631_102380 [Saccharomyces cerevisiae AWRI1631]|uniref:Uncharacterized protein n=1 Tax=Saccharomyces cerevisiae (strain AWRI1631) TaxID=545124 RepID=B5VLK0_YEAS6|nr:hypothetical protein AWRI1631_102380 [Saccharomyces cerevisiae AWRI1631]